MDNNEYNCKIHYDNFDVVVDDGDNDTILNESLLLLSLLGLVVDGLSSSFIWQPPLFYLQIFLFHTKQVKRRCWNYELSLGPIAFLKYTAGLLAAAVDLDLPLCKQELV